MNTLVNSPIHPAKSAPIFLTGRSARLYAMQQQLHRALGQPGNARIQRECLGHIIREAHAAGDEPVIDWLIDWLINQLAGQVGTTAEASAMPPSGQYCCNKCGQSFQSQPALNGHKKAHRYARH